MKCDRIARAYRYLEYLAFGRVLQSCRTTFLERASQCHSALLIGDGDGRFLERLCDRNRTIKVCSVDASGAMLELQSSRIRATAHDRVRFHMHDIRLGVPGSGYDFIAAHFFFDCLLQSEVDSVVERIASAAAPNATWVTSEFRIPQGFWRKSRASLWIGVMYAFFRVTTGLRVRMIPGYAEALSRNGFTLTECKAFSAGMINAEVWKRELEIPEEDRCSTRGAESKRR